MIISQFHGCGASNPIQLFSQTILQKSPLGGLFTAKRTLFNMSYYRVICFALYITHNLCIIQRRRSNTFHNLPLIRLAMATAGLPLYEVMRYSVESQAAGMIFQP